MSLIVSSPSREELSFGAFSIVSHYVSLSLVQFVHTLVPSSLKMVFSSLFAGIIMFSTAVVVEIVHRSMVLIFNGSIHVRMLLLPVKSV